MTSITSSKTASSGAASSIDVASIVSQLMIAEGKPLALLKNKIAAEQLFISDLGKITSNVAALKDTLGVIENPATFSKLSAASSDTSVVTATTSKGAIKGTHLVTVSQAAQKTLYNITGFNTNKAVINLDAINGFQITAGDTIYSTKGTKTVQGVTTTNAIAAIGKTGIDTNNQAVSTVLDLQNWIEQLNINISTNFVKQNASNWVLQVYGTQVGLSNDFLISGLVSGNTISGFSANNSTILLDPAIGFKLTVSGQTYSTLGTLASNTTIDALANWVNGLNVDVSASVTGNAGNYSLQLNPKNSTSFTTAGLCAAYATGFNSPTELISLDSVNGFQITVGNKIYKTAGSGAIAISGTGAGGSVTVTDLRDWINNLSGANLSASVVGSGTNYSLEINNTNPLAASVIALSGINSPVGANITTVAGFTSTSSTISLDESEGFQITVAGTTYKTAQGGMALGGKTVPILATSGPSSTSTLDDLKTWINSLSTVYGLGLSAVISNTGALYSLSITGAEASTIAGINSNAVLSEFNAPSTDINLAIGGFNLIIGNTTYKSNGDKEVGGVTTSTPGNALAANPTLSSLNTWINTVAGGDVSSSIIGSGNSYSLLIEAKSSTDNVSVTGLVSISKFTAQSLTGFSSDLDPISLDTTNGFQITLGGTTYNTKTSGTTLATTYTGSGGESIASLTDLKNWINELSIANSLQLSASIRTSGDNTKQLDISQTGGSELTLLVSGINSSAGESGFNSNSSEINLNVDNGFELKIGSTTYSTKGLGGAPTLPSSTTITDLKNWINNLGGGSLAKADLIYSGSNYQLMVNSINSEAVGILKGIVNSVVSTNSVLNPASSSISATASSTAPIGTNTISITQTATARTYTYSSPSSLANLDSVNGFSITIGSATYKTSQSGNTVNGHVVPTLSGGATPSVTDLSNWITSLSSTYTLGISAAVTSSGSNTILTITGSKGAENDFTIAGLFAPANIISGFSSPTVLIAFGSSGFNIALTGGSSFSTATTAITGSGPGGTTTLNDLKDWINDLNMGVTASVTGSGSAYNLQILQTGNPSTLIVSGLIPNSVDMGFPSANATINLDAATGFTITLGSTSYSTNDVGRGIVGTGINNAVTATDLKNWINSILSGGAQVFNADLVGNGTNFSLNVASFDTSNTNSIALSGIDNATASSNESVLRATSNTSAISGTHAVKITQNAAATVFNVGGFVNDDALVDVNNLYLIVGNVAYYANGDKLTGATIGYDSSLINTLTGGALDLAAISNLISQSATNDGQVTITQLANWINGLNDNVQADVQRTANGGSQLHVNGTLTGSANAVGMAYLGNTNIGDPSGGLGVTSIAINGGITEQGSLGARAFILKGTSSDYVLVDDPRNIVYDGSAQFWQGPASAVDSNYVNDISRGQQFYDANGVLQWIGQPGVVLDQSQGSLISVTATFTGNLQTNGTVSLSYDYNSSMNNVTIARNAKGTIDNIYFDNSTNTLTNINNTNINLQLVQDIAPYDSAVDVNVIISNPTGYSNLPDILTPDLASISQSNAATDTQATINGQSYSQDNLNPITVNGVTYSYTGTVSSGDTPILATVEIQAPTLIKDLANIQSTTSTSSLTQNNNQVTRTYTNNPSNTITSTSANRSNSYLSNGGINKYLTAQDAHLTIDGMSISRSSNTISDFTTGLTYNVTGKTSAGKSANVTVSLAANITQDMIIELITAYNKVIINYNEMTTNGNNKKTNDGKPGTFGNSPTVLYFVEGIKRRFATGATYNIGKTDANGKPYILSLASLGIDYQLDGTLKFNKNKYDTLAINDLKEKLVNGLRIGYVSPTDNLMTYVKGQIIALTQEMTIEKSSIDSSTERQDLLQEKLDKIQASYFAQYSSLNALLFKLNSTSTSLTNALTGLSNMSKDN